MQANADIAASCSECNIFPFWRLSGRPLKTEDKSERRLLKLKYFLMCICRIPHSWLRGYYKRFLKKIKYKFWMLMQLGNGSGCNLHFTYQRKKSLRKKNAVGFLSLRVATN